MHSLPTILNFVDNYIYAPNKFTVSDVKEKLQNAEYAAATFKLTTELTIKTVRFRVAKITPNKIGQFVTFWEKDDNGVNQAYQYEQAPDLLVITAFKNADFNIHDSLGCFGQFVFPKEILLEHNILKSDTIKGKMGMRVYPSWDRPTSATAIKTQQWQLDYFFAITNINALPTEKIAALYN